MEQSHQNTPRELSSAGKGRPYRSHKVPACDRCRKRKLRCAIDVPGQPCNLCQNSRAICIQNHRGGERYLPMASTQPTSSQSTKRYLSFNDDSPESFLTTAKSPDFHSTRGSDVEFTSSSIAAAPDRTEAAGSKSSMIVGPVMAEDVQMIETYMSSSNNQQPSTEGQRYDTVSDNPDDPVLYLSVPRRRQGLAANNRPGEKQREILEQILGQLVHDVVALYFEFIHPSFPVLDEEHFLQLYRTGNSNLSAALVCDVLTSALIYWNRSPRLKQYPRPDLRYAWNLAVAALHEEYFAPGMSTINAALVDLTGRPTTSITGNTINSSRTVALSHVLGLNRNPETWKVSEAEKKMRVRLWWGILIHDRWSSFAHGVPTYITQDQYEVPVPTIKSLLTDGLETNSRIEAARCFIALCTLTEVLGDILPLVYSRRPKPETEVSRALRKLETQIDTWEDSDPARLSLQDRGDLPPISGSSSLKLGFLSAKMLMRRIAFRTATHSLSPSLPETRQYAQALLRESARSITTFLCSLTSHNLGEFWSPYTAYHMASATIILLRCTIETLDPTIRANCKESLLTIVDWLRRAKEMDDWDLADICLAQCEGSIMKICAPDVEVDRERDVEGRREELRRGSNLQVGMRDIFEGNGWVNGVHMGPSVMDTQNEVNGFEYPWADIWDSF